jgi:integrase
MIEKTYDSFIVDARPAGRGRIRGATVEEAKQNALPVAQELAKQGQEAVQLPMAERRIYLTAKKELQPLGLAVDEGARRLAEILKQLNGDSFESVMALYRANSKKLKLGVTTLVIYEEYLHEQEKVRGNSKYQLRDVRKFVGKFVEKYPGEILLIETEDIDTWLENLGGMARNKNNARDHVIAFFNFAAQKKYLLKDHVALDAKEFKDPRPAITNEQEALEAITDVEFYTPDEMRRILAASSIRLRPSLELKAFSGIRTEEMIRFWWVFVQEQNKIIKIPKQIAKLKSRTTPITDNLGRRLAVYDNETKQGPVCKDWTLANSLYHAWHRTCEEAGVPYKKNAFRDCYITYRVALTNDPKLVAQESGNSEKMIRENYLHLTTKEQAEEWFPCKARSSLHRYRLGDRGR